MTNGLTVPEEVTVRRELGVVVPMPTLPPLSFRTMFWAAIPPPRM